MAGGNRLDKIDHIVVLMLENRSFDHLLGLLYADHGNRSPSGADFDGLTGDETNPDATGKPVGVFPITAATDNPYLMPGADPGEGFVATNLQLFAAETPPANATASNQGFVTDFTRTLAWETKNPRWHVVKGTRPSSIMGVYTPELLPVLSSLARGFAVCDRWFASVPTETMPNRAFVNAGTSQGHIDDKTKSFTCRSIFGMLSKHGVDWRIYGYNTAPLTRLNFPDTTAAPHAHFGRFDDFLTAARTGTLAPYTFLEPDWGSDGNSQHPNFDMAKGEALIYDVYVALRNGPHWAKTLFVIVYDEHGGCYDHVPPPRGAKRPDGCLGEAGFDFRRFGVRVPAVLVSPWIPAGTVFRAPDGSPPLDHTSILATVEQRFGVPALTARDRAAAHLGHALTATTARTDDPLKSVKPPPPSPVNPSAGEPSHLQRIHAELLAAVPIGDTHRPLHETLGKLRSGADYTEFINERTAAWCAATA